MKHGAFRGTVASLLIGFCGAAGAARDEVRIEEWFDYDAPPSSLRIPAPAEIQLSTAKGLKAAQALFSVNFLPPGPHGSYTCVAWTAQAQAAFNYATAIWSSKLRSPVPIVIDACYASMGTGQLNSYSYRLAKNFTNNPLFDTNYTQSLANALSGADVNPAAPDIDVTFNVDFNWYYGTDGNTPPAQTDFVTALLKIIGTSMGFTGSMDVVAGSGSWGPYPDIYDYFTTDAAGQSLKDLAVYPNPSTALGAALRSGSVYFDGGNARAANGGARVPLHAPATWGFGNSYVHLADSFNGTPNALMTRSLASGASIHDPGPVALGMLRDLGWQLNGSSATADIGLSSSANVNPATTGKDVIFTVTATNNGPDTGTGVVVATAYDPAATVIWVTPGCVKQGSFAIYSCNAGTLANGASAQFQVVLRKATAGTIYNSAAVSSTSSDPTSINDMASSTIPVDASAPAAQALRYRLYSPVTLEHHFTTDLNEYNVLGTYVGTWQQEGTVGNMLDNPGSFGGVAAVPYYRLYNTGNQWHHWTTDANEYYTLITFPGWNGEGVDGYLLPSAATGATQLYRLNYPGVPGLHHWTIDANEYDTLITPAYGWIGEGGAGFVIQ